MRRIAVAVRPEMWQQHRDQHKRDDQHEPRDDALVNGAWHHRLPVVHTGLVIRMGICCPVEVAHKTNRSRRRLAVCLILSDGAVENAKRRVEDSQHQRHHCKTTDTKQRRQRLHSHRIRESCADRTMRLCRATLHDCALYHEVLVKAGSASGSWLQRRVRETDRGKTGILILIIKCLFE